MNQSSFLLPAYVPVFFQSLCDESGIQLTSDIRAVLESQTHTVVEGAFYDNWDGGITGHEVEVEIPRRLYMTFSKEQRTEIESELCNRLNGLNFYDDEYIGRVKLKFALYEDDESTDTTSGSRQITRYSTRLNPPPAINDSLSPRFIQAIFTEFERLIETHAFAKRWPIQCPDGNLICGTNTNQLLQQMLSEIPLFPTVPSIGYAVNTTDETAMEWKAKVVWDLIEFIYQYGHHAEEDSYHSYFSHYHLHFDDDQETFRSNFRQFLQLHLQTHGLAYELTPSGMIQRRLSTVQKQLFDEIDKRWWLDEDVTKFLQRSRNHFLSHKEGGLELALKDLWAAFERIKTLEADGNKKKSTEQLIARMAGETDFYELLNTEAVELTKIGNKYSIRHSEKDQKSVQTSEHARYLYFRMLAFLRLAAQNL